MQAKKKETIVRPRGRKRSGLCESTCCGRCRHGYRFPIQIRELTMTAGLDADKSPCFGIKSSEQSSALASVASDRVRVRQLDLCYFWCCSVEYLKSCYDVKRTRFLAPA